MPSHRIDRLNSDMQRELSSLIKQLKDPRIDDFLSVMRVEVTSDLSHAKVYIGSINGLEQATEACAVLRHAAGHLRTELSRRLHIRKAPELSFIPDGSAEYYEKITSILEKYPHEQSDGAQED